MNDLPRDDFERVVRREFLFQAGLGLGSMALGSLMANDAAAAGVRGAVNPLAVKPPHHPPRAKAVIQLFMAGGPSQLELFDYKPKLQAMSGQIVPPSYVEGKNFAFIKRDAKLLGTQRRCRKYGQSGAEVSELLPHTASIVDELA